jgi:hypothetical protein
LIVFRLLFGFFEPASSRILAEILEDMILSRSSVLEKILRESDDLIRELLLESPFVLPVLCGKPNNVSFGVLGCV